MNNIDHYWPPIINTYTVKDGMLRKKGRVCQGAPKTAVFFLLNTKPSWEILFLLLKGNS